MIVTTTRQYLDVPGGQTVTLFNFGDTLYVGDQTVSAGFNESTVLNGGTITLTDGRYLVSNGWSRVEEDITPVSTESIVSATVAPVSLPAGRTWRTPRPERLNLADYMGAGEDMHAAVARAMARLPASGGELFLGALDSGNAYNTRGVVIDNIVRNGITVRGAGAATVVRTDTWQQALFGNPADNTENFRIAGVVAQGAAVDDTDPAIPIRARTFPVVGGGTVSWDFDTTAPAFLGGFGSMILLQGDLFGSFPVIRNVAVERCKIMGTTDLPAFIKGCRGDVEFIFNEVVNSRDTGFTFNEHLVASFNRILRSADNGLSLSRGNQSIRAIGNRILTACYNGIWTSGFATDVGPTNFTVAANVIKNVGLCGVIADGAPSGGAIVANMIDGGYFRGPVDRPTDSYGSGVYVGGLPAGSTSPTADAHDINVTGNTIRRMPRAGVAVHSGTTIKVADNHIIDVGTQFLADGVTAIATNDGNQNSGVLFIHPELASDCTVNGNSIVDRRATPYLNYGVRPQTAPTRSNYVNNTVTGARNLYDLVDVVETSTNTRRIAGLQQFDSQVKAVGGITAGSNSGGGSTKGFDINGAAGITRPVRWLTAGVERWRARTGTTAESGANAGSNWALEAYDDTGALLSTPISIERATGKVTFAADITTPNVGGYGFPATVDPGVIRSGDTMAVQAANVAHYARVRDGGTITKIGLSVGTQSGNISVAAYGNSGSGRSAVPGTRLSTSGAVACPATGYQEVALGGAVTLAPGDWLCLTADNTVAKFNTLLSTGADNNLGLGRQFRQATAHPAPSPPASLVATIGYPFVLVGVA